MKHIELRNQSKNEFTDISSELWREYWFTPEMYVSIEHPLYLSVSESGGHRILDTSEVSYYIPKGWIALTWRAKDEAPHFVK